MLIDVTPMAPPDWDRYVEHHPATTAYHRAAAVRIGGDVFGLRTAFLAARTDSRQICGVLPLVEQSSFLFGRFLVSLPFFTYGGVLADGDGIALALIERAAELAKERRAGHMELRHTSPIAGLQLAERVDKVSMVRELPSSEELLAKQFGSKLRSQIRRADRELPQLSWGGSELIPDFYRVFAVTMHGLGTPVYPKEFFRAVCDALQGLLSVLVVHVRGQVQAAAILVRHGSRIEVPWAAATPAAKRSAINMRMYAEMLRAAVRSGAAAFDFGRSTIDSGTYRFKEQWGAAPQQLYWYYWLSSGTKVPRLNQENPKYALAAAVWKRLPLWCANLIGPRIVRNLP